MASPFLGEIKLFAGNFAPRGWAFCNGQLLSIAQNSALFALLGTIYGGDGVTTFALPDLRGRVPVHLGQGPGLSNYPQGTTGGAETVTLAVTQIPSHAHTLNASDLPGAATSPANNFIAEPNPGLGKAANPAFNSSASTTLAPGAVSATGGGQAHENRPPYLTLNYIISLQGIFPSRN